MLTPEPGAGAPDVGLGFAFPDPLNPPPGRPFHPRYVNAFAPCATTRPATVPIGEGRVACHLHDPAMAGAEAA